MEMQLLAYSHSAGFLGYLADMVFRAVVYGAIWHVMRFMSGGAIVLLVIAAIGLMWVMSRSGRW